MVAGVSSGKKCDVEEYAQHIEWGGIGCDLEESYTVQEIVGKGRYQLKAKNMYNEVLRNATDLLQIL